MKQLADEHFDYPAPKSLLSLHGCVFGIMVFFILVVIGIVLVVISVLLLIFRHPILAGCAFVLTLPVLLGFFFFRKAWQYFIEEDDKPKKQFEEVVLSRHDNAQPRTMIVRDLTEQANGREYFYMLDEKGEKKFQLRCKNRIAIKRLPPYELHLVVDNVGISEYRENMNWYFAAVPIDPTASTITMETVIDASEPRIDPVYYYSGFLRMRYDQTPPSGWESAFSENLENHMERVHHFDRRCIPCWWPAAFETSAEPVTDTSRCVYPALSELRTNMVKFEARILEQSGIKHRDLFVSLYFGFINPYPL